MLKNQEIIRIKKGLYILSPEFGGIISKCTLSNLIYGPSYVSFEYALSYWGLIPEKVEEVTAATNKRNKTFSTPTGKYSYYFLNNSAYSIGQTLALNDEGSFLIASKEKALCDKMARASDVKKVQDVKDYLEGDLRIDSDELLNFNIQLLEMIRVRYQKKTISLLCEWMKQNC